MLSRTAASPDPHLATYVESFLRESPWLRRRVDTLAFRDVDTVTRRTTLDLGGAELQSAIAQCPMFPDRPLVPLALLTKDLLVNFDLRDSSGRALTIVPRDVDTYFAWSNLVSVADQVLGHSLERVSPAVTRRLREIAFDFPAAEDSPLDNELRSWVLPSSFQPTDTAIWRRLIADETFARRLRDFTFSFILIAQVPCSATQDSTQVIKFSYDENLPYSRRSLLEWSGLQATEMVVEAPAIGWARSYHLRIQSTTDLSLTDIGLFREPSTTSVNSSPTEYYQVRQSHESMQVYAPSSHVAPGDYLVAVSIRVPILGYLRSLWVTTLFVAGILGVAWSQIDRLESAVRGQQTDAAVALLLLAPALMAAYLTRPNEHAIASRLLKPVRYAVGISGLMAYVAAGVLVLDAGDLRRYWTALTVGSLLSFIFVTLVVIITSRELREASKSSGVTRSLEIYALEPTDSTA